MNMYDIGIKYVGWLNWLSISIMQHWSRSLEAPSDSAKTIKIYHKKNCYNQHTPLNCKKDNAANSFIIQKQNQGYKSTIESLDDWQKPQTISFTSEEPEFDRRCGPEIDPICLDSKLELKISPFPEYDIGFENNCVSTYQTLDDQHSISFVSWLDFFLDSAKIPKVIENNYEADA